MTGIIVAVRAAVRAIPKLLGQTLLPVFISEAVNQLDLAHRLDQPSMTSDWNGEERRSEDLQHL